MNILSKSRLALLLVIFLGFSAFVYAGTQAVSAQEGEDHTVGQAEEPEEEQDREEENRAQEEQKDEEQPSQALGTYVYTAQPGDSYTLLARKAAQTYGKKFRVNLSLADIIFVETNLTQAAGSPHLNEGQQVEVSESTVKEWVDRASQLSEAEEAAWDYYVQFVDSFNTDGVGQAH